MEIQKSILEVGDWVTKKLHKQGLEYAFVKDDIKVKHNLSVYSINNTEKLADCVKKVFAKHYDGKELESERHTYTYRVFLWFGSENGGLHFRG